MRIPLPPGWRSLAAGRVEPWLLLAILASLAGAGWVLSPSGAAERVRDRVYGRPGTLTATGRALGYSAGYRTNPYVDPLGVLLQRERIAIGAGGSPVYQGKRTKPAVQPPLEFTAPIRTQDFRPLGALAPYRQPGAKPGIAITAADVLRPQAPA